MDCLLPLGHSSCGACSRFFWRQLGEVDALVVVAYRVFWSFSFLLLALPAILAWSDSETRQVVRNSLVSPRVWSIYLLAGGFIAINWLTFVWAVNHERVLEASLGYYINPLLNVLLGVGLLGERLTRLQWTAIASATLGVAVLTFAGGGLPWVSLVLACSFALYSLVKKKAPLPALVGLLFETTTLLVSSSTTAGVSQSLGANEHITSDLVVGSTDGTGRNCYDRTAGFVRICSQTRSTFDLGAYCNMWLRRCSSCWASLRLAKRSHFGNCSDLRSFGTHSSFIC